MRSRALVRGGVRKQACIFFSAAATSVLLTDNKGSGQRLLEDARVVIAEGPNRKGAGNFGFCLRMWCPLSSYILV